MFDNRLSSEVALVTPRDDTATGHCALSYETWVGRCAFKGGTEELAGFRANLEVTFDPATGAFTWEGTYHVDDGRD